MMFFRDGHDRVHVGGLTIQMDRDNPDRGARYLLFQESGINCKRIAVGVAKHDLGSRLSNGL